MRGALFEGEGNDPEKKWRELVRQASSADPSPSATPRSSRPDIGDHKVKLVAEIEGFEAFADKRAIIGRVLPSDHPVAARWRGQPSPDGFRSPTTYHPDGDGPATCACGCDEPVKPGRAFSPGHDQRAIHERIEEQWGDTLGFIRWFDQNYRVA